MKYKRILLPNAAKTKFSEKSLQKGLTNGKKRGIILPASDAMVARRYMEMDSRGRRGAPAKGVGRVYRRESSNLSISANEKDPTAKAVGSFSLLQCRDLKIAPRVRDRRRDVKPRPTDGGRSKPPRRIDTGDRPAVSCPADTTQRSVPNIAAPLRMTLRGYIPCNLSHEKLLSPPKFQKIPVLTCIFTKLVLQ